MKYFKNTELAKLYHVSEKSVRNWIDGTRNGKLNLQLHQEKDKFFVANTSKNITIIEDLAQRGKKFKNTRGLKVIMPSDEFFTLYSPKQIIDILSNIDVHREIPLQYTYFNSGAKSWDAYTHLLLEQNTPNSSLRNTIDLLRVNRGYLDTLIAGYKRVNVIDLGPGNALPIREFLDHLLRQGVLHRYVGIDISKEMLEIARTNIEQWFEGQVRFEGYIRDVVYERFDDLLVDDVFTRQDEPILNIALFLGGTLNNFREPDRALETICDSMSRKDVLIFSKKLDTARSRRHFDQTASGNQDMELVLKLMNIDPSYYTLEQYFDENKMARELRAKFDVAVSIRFDLNGRERILDLNKDDSILLWRARHQTAAETINQFDKNGFELLQACRSQDQDYIQLISKIKTRTS